MCVANVWARVARRSPLAAPRPPAARAQHTVYIQHSAGTLASLPLDNYYLLQTLNWNDMVSSHIQIQQAVPNMVNGIMSWNI